MGSAALSLGKEAFRRKSAIPICALALALCVFTDISNVVMIVAGVILALSIRAVKKTRGGQTAELSQTFYSVYENRIYQLWRNVDDPVIMQEMKVNQWMTAEDLTNLIAIAEMTPGPLGINCATFAGMQTAGVLGGIAAVMGVLMPAYTLTLGVAVCFAKFRGNDIMSCMLNVIKPICIAMILAVILDLMQENYFPDARIDWLGCGIGVVMFYLILKKNWSVPKVITLAAVFGIVGYGVLGIG